MTRKSLIDFYRGTKYKSNSLSIRGIPPRPSEWNVPLFIKQIYPGNVKLFNKSFNGDFLEIELEQQDLEDFKALLLHESLFDFYKAFYNYLCALKLYDGGLQHWIEITAYYAKFYLAKSILALTGRTRYIVSGSGHNFVEDIYKLINIKGYQKNCKRNGNFNPKHAKYGIEINVNAFSNEGKLIITKNLGSGGSHGYVWNKYSALNTKEFGITEIIYNYPQYLSEQRNLENYSFEGYSQLDFNLSVENFESYFQREYIKGQSTLIYTSETVMVLGVFGELLNLYKELGVLGLPIEMDKLKTMCEYALGNSVQTRKLNDLIDSGFPSRNKYLDEYHRYEST